MMESYGAIGPIALIGEQPARINPWNVRWRTLRLSSALAQTFIRVRKDAYENRISLPKAHSCRALHPFRACWGRAGSRSGANANNSGDGAVARRLNDDRASRKSVDRIQVAAEHTAEHQLRYRPRDRSRLSSRPERSDRCARHTPLGDRGPDSRNRQCRIYLCTAMGA